MNAHHAPSASCAADAMRCSRNPRRPPLAATDAAADATVVVVLVVVVLVVDVHKPPRALVGTAAQHSTAALEARAFATGAIIPLRAQRICPAVQQRRQLALAKFRRDDSHRTRTLGVPEISQGHVGPMVVLARAHVAALQHGVVELSLRRLPHASDARLALHPLERRQEVELHPLPTRGAHRPPKNVDVFATAAAVAATASFSFYLSVSAAYNAISRTPVSIVAHAQTTVLLSLFPAATAVATNTPIAPSTAATTATTATTTAAAAAATTTTTAAHQHSFALILEMPQMRRCCDGG